MKPFDLYSYIRLNTRERFSKNKLPFYLSRAKKALDNLHSLGWNDEEIKVLILNTVKSLAMTQKPITFAYIIAILINTRISPVVKSVEQDDSAEYNDWILKEIERLNANA